MRGAVPNRGFRSGRGEGGKMERMGRVAIGNKTIHLLQ